jgi:hypothetical protein
MRTSQQTLRDVHHRMCSRSIVTTFGPQRRVDVMLFWRDGNDRRTRAEGFVVFISDGPHYEWLSLLPLVAGLAYFRFPFSMWRAADSLLLLEKATRSPQHGMCTNDPTTTETKISMTRTTGQLRLPQKPSHWQSVSPVDVSVATCERAPGPAKTFEGPGIPFTCTCLTKLYIVFVYILVQ